jgi:hypothetical protein
MRFRYVVLTSQGDRSFGDTEGSRRQAATFLSTGRLNLVKMARTNFAALAKRSATAAGSERYRAAGLTARILFGPSVGLTAVAR